MIHDKTKEAFTRPDLTYHGMGRTCASGMACRIPT